MQFHRLKRLAWALGIDKEFCQLGWRRGRFITSYYRGRLQDHRWGARQPLIRAFEVTHRINQRRARLYLRTGPDGDDWTVMRGVWLHQDYFHPAVAQSRTILDVGANIGMAAVWFRDLIPDAQIACVEPDRRNLPLLRINLAANRMKVPTFECAVATTSGEAPFGIGLETGWSSLQETGLHQHRQFVQVKTRRIPDILDDLAWPRVDLLKLDIEGAEKQIIADAKDWLWRVGMIVFELHRNSTVEEIAAMFRQFGWAIEAIGTHDETTFLARRFTSS